MSRFNEEIVEQAALGWVTEIGYFVLKEPFGPRRAAATAMVVFGIAVIQLSRAAWL